MASKTKSKSHKQKKRTGTGTIVVVCAIVAAFVVAGILILPGLFQKGYTPDNETDPIATITLQNGKKIIAELYPDKAPNTVANFVELANKGFYDGLTFHRVISGFMIQGGDPDGVGTGGPGYSIRGEFASNGFEQNDIKHVRGVLSMARAQAFDSAGSQFFIMHADANYLDGAYAAFGRVLDGMEAVDAIAATQTNPQNNRPLTPQVIKSIRVDTKGVSYTAEKIGGQ